MNKKRLLKLADFLETVPPTAFVLSQWVKSHPIRPEGERPGGCGFSGCAIGWAIHGKLFRGFKFGGALDNRPKYREADNWAAVDKVFGLEGGTAHEYGKDAGHLFYDLSYPPHFNATPKQVAKRIRKFVAGES